MISLKKEYNKIKDHVSYEDYEETCKSIIESLKNEVIDNKDEFIETIKRINSIDDIESCDNEKLKEIFYSSVLDNYNEFIDTFKFISIQVTSGKTITIDKNELQQCHKKNKISSRLCQRSKQSQQSKRNRLSQRSQQNRNSKNYQQSSQQSQRNQSSQCNQSNQRNQQSQCNQLTNKMTIIPIKKFNGYTDSDVKVMRKIKFINLDKNQQQCPPEKYFKYKSKWLRQFLNEVVCDPKAVKYFEDTNWIDTYRGDPNRFCKIRTVKGGARFMLSWYSFRMDKNKKVTTKFNRMRMLTHKSYNDIIRDLEDEQSKLPKRIRSIDVLIRILKCYPKINLMVEKKLTNNFKNELSIALDTDYNIMRDSPPTGLTPSDYFAINGLVKMVYNGDTDKEVELITKYCEFLNRVNEANEVDKVNEVNETNLDNEVNKVNEVGETNKVKEVKEVNKVNGVDKVNKVNEVNETNLANEVGEANGVKVDNETLVKESAKPMKSTKSIKSKKSVKPTESKK